MKEIIEILANLATALGIPIALIVGFINLIKNRNEKIGQAQIEYSNEFSLYSKLRKDFLFKKSDFANFKMDDFHNLMYDMIVIFGSLEKLLSLMAAGKIKNFYHLQLLLGDMQYFMILIKKFKDLRMLGVNHFANEFLPDIINFMGDSDEAVEIKKLKQEIDLLLVNCLTDGNAAMELQTKWQDFMAASLRTTYISDDNSLIKRFLLEKDWMQKQYESVQLSSTYNFLSIHGQEINNEIVKRQISTKEMKPFAQSLNKGTGKSKWIR